MTDYKSNVFEKAAGILIQKATARKNRKNRSLYINAAILATYGWHVCIPVLLGIILGQFLDKNFPIRHISWTLNFLVLGFITGWYNATKWINKEGIKKRNTKQKEDNK